MSLDQRARDVWAEIRDEVATIEPPTASVIVRRSRRGRVATGLAALAVLALAGVGLAVALQDAPAPTRLQITDDPEPTTVPDAPVWYDARGLHHGDVVEQTPVELLAGEDGHVGVGALALVRSGAVYLDPATGDVWFHPWGGEPRIVGHNSLTRWPLTPAGPGGDPNGDTAAWFDGSELVVYDTAAGHEISRTEQPAAVDVLTGDHYPVGNRFLQVSAERVVWQGIDTSGQYFAESSSQYSYDLRTGRTSVVEIRSDRFFVDVQDQVEISAGPVDPSEPGGDQALVLSGYLHRRYPDLETHARLSPSGNYVLAVEGAERHAAAIVDTRTGELWQVPNDTYPWIAWSYGDIALVDTDGPFLACDAARRTCERLHPDGPFLMPTN
jgi:hypothetical protein